MMKLSTTFTSVTGNCSKTSIAKIQHRSQTKLTTRIKSDEW